MVLLVCKSESRVVQYRTPLNYFLVTVKTFFLFVRYHTITKKFELYQLGCFCAMIKKIRNLNCCWKHLR
jgi:hypothetical protein